MNKDTYILTSSSLSLNDTLSVSSPIGDLDRDGARGIIGVIAGLGIGVGNSLIGDKHLLILFGISNRIVGGHKRFVLDEVALCADTLSMTGTSIADCR